MSYCCDEVEILAVLFCKSVKRATPLLSGYALVGCLSPVCVSLPCVCVCVYWCSWHCCTLHRSCQLAPRMACVLVSAAPGKGLEVLTFVCVDVKPPKTRTLTSFHHFLTSTQTPTPTPTTSTHNQQPLTQIYFLLLS